MLRELPHETDHTLLFLWKLGGTLINAELQRNSTRALKTLPRLQNGLIMISVITVNTEWINNAGTLKMKC